MKIGNCSVIELVIVMYYFTINFLFVGAWYKINLIVIKIGIII